MAAGQHASQVSACCYWALAVRPFPTSCACPLTHLRGKAIIEKRMQVEVPGPRKSVGAEVNYGIRFAAEQDATAFITELAGEVEKRMAICNARGRTVTLKLKRCSPADPSTYSAGFVQAGQRLYILPRIYPRFFTVLAFQES